MTQPSTPFPTALPSFRYGSRLAKSAARGTRALALAAGLAALALLLGIVRPPSNATGRALFDGERELVRMRSNAVAATVDSHLERGDFPTGSARFDGEWLLVTHVMAALGHAQVATEYSDPDELARAERAIDRMLEPDLRAFDREAWRGDALADLGSDRAHGGYLSYAGLALAVAEEAGSTRRSQLRREIAEHLFARYEANGGAAIETYPGEAYPPDNAAALAAIAVSFRLDGRDGADALVDRFFARHRDPNTGLLAQAVDANSSEPVDVARGSGTLWASYLISFASARISRELYESAMHTLFVDGAGFGAMREYAGSGTGDIDSGPVVFGLGLSATGFALGAARANGDREAFTRLYATAHLFGLPLCHEDRCNYVTGMSIGDAILFAMVTAQPART